MLERDVMLLSFTLRKRGMRMEYNVLRPVQRGSMTMMSEVLEKSPFPPTGEILNVVHGMKVFVARALGLWYDGFDKFCNDRSAFNPYNYKMDADEYRKASSTLDAIDIIMVSFNGGYRFVAMVETIPGKVVKMRTPLITEDDDLFEQMEPFMDVLNGLVKVFVEDSAYDFKHEAKSIVERIVGVEQVQTMSEKEIFLMAIDRMEELGAVVMYSEELEREIAEARRDLPLLKAQGEDDLKSEEMNESVSDWASRERGYEKGVEDDVEKDEKDTFLPENERSILAPEGREDEGDRNPDDDGSEEDQAVAVEEHEGKFI